ncbi:hypothetical protein G7Y89_g7485 [Cudoniella acicularis]|uniref:ABM domain-containing protein n=1 Tax=Cudoniella acicularis TaxID=354080 RepID=A0A8H4RIG3_9HELO|nr:hypothetical protein G7Y89_g7485 [Cudoniella acicularis]
MPILEVCKRRLKDGVSATNPSLLKVFPEIRSATKTNCVSFSGIESPSTFYILGVWPSIATHDAFVAAPETPAVMAPLDALCDFERVEFMNFDSIESLPYKAPVMAVTRAFLKNGNHPEEYYRKISDLKAPIEGETNLYPCVFS